MKHCLNLLLLLAGLHVFSQYDIRRVDSLLRTVYMDKEPGAGIAIQVNGKTVFEQGYGLANLSTGEANTVHTNFNIGSLTKQFTAFSILELVEQKRLKLDNRLSDFFPSFNKHVAPHVSIRQLLTHSSGILDHYGFTDTSKVKHATDHDVLTAVMNTDSFYFGPGSSFRYSNTAYCLLGDIIEKISGIDYPTYIRTKIFKPLEMESSKVFQMNADIARRAYGYDTLGGKYVRSDAAESIFFSTEADGGIYTSIDDYLKWLSRLNHAKGLTRALVDSARSPQFTVNKEAKLAYGFGWFVSDRNADRIVYHTGSNGGFRSIVFSIPSRNYVVLIFSNRTGIDLEDLVRKINDIIGVAGKFYTKIDALESFNTTCPIFAPWKEITLYSA